MMPTMPTGPETGGLVMLPIRSPRPRRISVAASTVRAKPIATAVRGTAGCPERISAVKRIPSAPWSAVQVAAA